MQFVPEYNLWFVVNNIVYYLEFVYQVKLNLDRFCMEQRKIFKVQIMLKFNSNIDI